MEIAVDTNILVRLLVKDHREQYAIAYQLLYESNSVVVTDTVLLETEWVLRSLYKQNRATIQLSFATLLDLPVVRLLEPKTIRRALGWHAEGMDFADAMHLAKCGTRTLYTFDRHFVDKAKALGLKVQEARP